MILLTGATGFTGSFVLEELMKRKIPTRCFIREGAKRFVFEGKDCEIFTGNIHDVESWGKALEGASGIINIVSFKEAHIACLLEAAEKAEISKILLVSTTAIFTTLNAKSKKMRMETEKMIMESNVNWCIVRPTMIYGSNRDRNIARLIKFVNMSPIQPIFGDQDKLMQPIYVRDMAEACINAFFCKNAERKAYNLAGKEGITYRECISTIAQLLDKRVIFLPLPLSLSIILVKLASAVPFLPSITVEQVLRLNEDKVFSYEEAAKDFNFSPMSFREGVANEIATNL